MPNSETTEPRPAHRPIPKPDDGWAAVIALVQVVIQSNERQAVQTAQLVKDTQVAREEIKHLTRLITDDGGDRGLLLRTTLLERVAEENRKSLERIVEAVEKRDQGETTGKWSVANTLVAGIFALLAGLLSALAVWMSK